MNNREFLDILGEIDCEFVEEAFPVSNRDNNTPFKKKRRIKEMIAIAACCSLILCGALVAEPLFNAINSINTQPPANNHISGDRQDIGGNSEGTVNSQGSFPEDKPIFPLESDEHSVYESELPDDDVSEAATDIYVEPDYYFTVKISDESYEDFELSQAFCAPETVGEKIDEMTLEVRYGPDTASILAEVYSVLGVDSKLCLYIRYIDDGNDSAYNDFLDFDSYCMLYAKNYAFASLEEMLGIILDGGGLHLSEYCQYNMKTDAEYPQAFYLDTALSNELGQMILSTDGEAIDTLGGRLLETVHAEANEIVTVYCRTEGRLGPSSDVIRIYDTGYLTFSGFGGQLFTLGEEKGEELIDFVLSKGSPEGYIWIEEEQAWYPIGPDEDAEYSSFAEALIENKLMDQLYFVGEVGYTSTLYGGNNPNKLYLNEKFCLIVAEVLCAADGPAIAIEDITKLAKESIILTHVYGDESRALTVYDSGHVELDGHYYFIDTDYTDKILSAVRRNCAAEWGYYWNQNENKWDIYASNESESQKTEETHPEESVDVEYGSDVYETEIEYNYDY